MKKFKEFIQEGFDYDFHIQYMRETGLLAVEYKGQVVELSQENIDGLREVLEGGEYINSHDKPKIEIRKVEFNRINIHTIFVEYPDMPPVSITLTLEQVEEILNVAESYTLASEHDFNNLEPFNESFNIPGVRISEITVGLKPADKGHKTMIASYFNTFENYIDVEDAVKHIFKVNDLTGDVLNSNRVQFRVIILGEQEIEETVKNNITNLSISEFYTNLPNSLNIFGINMKPVSFINKDDLKFTFNNILSIDEIVKIITMISGFQYKGDKDGYHIWAKQL